MTTITEFLLARVAEDEAMAERESTWFGGSTPWALYEADHPGGIGIDPRRVLRQCEAIRRIVPIADAQSKWDALGSATDEDGWAILEALAAIWSDHPDHGGWWAA